MTGYRCMEHCRLETLLKGTRIIKKWDDCRLVGEEKQSFLYSAHKIRFKAFVITTNQVGGAFLSSIA